jgi:carboxyl-terminal processing protease
MGITGGRLETAARLLQGRPGSPVTLRIRREGAPLNVELHRDSVTTPPAIRVADLGGGVASIHINRIFPSVADSVRRSLEQIQQDGGRSVVLDLRGTAEGGNDLAAGARIADLFLNRGTVIAISKMRRASGTEDLTDSAPSPFADMPVAVLIDGGTAGAAEAVAGALQDHDRAIVLGTESYGRGATWRNFSLGNGAVLTLTTALWMTPNGRQIQRFPPEGSVAADTARPTIRSDRGRVLLGGGGIVPDRAFPDADSEVVLSEARRILLRAATPANVFALDRPE